MKWYTQRDFNEKLLEYTQLNNDQHARIFNDLDKLRDDLNALANRIESLTRAVRASTVHSVPDFTLSKAPDVSA